MEICTGISKLIALPLRYGNGSTMRFFIFLFPGAVLIPTSGDPDLCGLSSHSATACGTPHTGRILPLQSHGDLALQALNVSV